jgi:protein-S-isoprenylcysteine O-methyltransferase Ste14
VAKLIIFVLVSAPLLWFSWPFLRDRHTHGFYRFFAFETILVLLLVNVDRWFLNPFSPLQILSWVLLILSLCLAIHGFYLLRMIGRPERNFEDTTRLVIVGAYKYIRHPLYASLLFLGWGIFFKDVSLQGGLLALVGSLFLVATARTEESENVAKFGSEYKDYIKSTRMFIPFVF